MAKVRGTSKRESSPRFRQSRGSGNPVSLGTNATGAPLKPALECLNRGRGRRKLYEPGTLFTDETGQLVYRLVRLWANLDRQEHRRRKSLDHPPYDPVRSLGGDLRHHVLVGDHLAELALEGKIARVACDLVR